VKVGKNLILLKMKQIDIEHILHDILNVICVLRGVLCVLCHIGLICLLVQLYTS